MMTMYMESWQGWAVLIGLGVLSFVLSEVFWRSGKEGKMSYLLGSRAIPWFPLAGSIAATWLAAQVLFVTATQGYEAGWVGVFWFTVPNVGSLVLFAFIAKYVRKRVPDGITLSEAVRRRSSRQVQGLYQIILLTGQVLQFAVQLTAGGILLTAVTGMDYRMLVAAIAAIVLLYTIKTGIKATILTDTLQVLLVVIVLGGLAVWFAVEAGEFILTGLTGPEGEHTSLFGGPGAELFFTFGLVSGLGLFLGPLNDQSFWQRAWAGKEAHLGRAFIVGALMFAVAPLSVMLFGFAASGAGLDIDPQMANLEGMTAWLPAWTAIPFSVVILAGILSTSDSQLSAAASVIGHDFTRDPARAVRNGRWAMVAVTMVALAIALVPGSTVLTLFTVFAAVRMTPTGVTVLLLFTNRTFNPVHVMYGLLGGLLIGVPMVAVGTVTGQVMLIFPGTVIALLVPLLGASLGARRRAGIEPEVSL